MSKQTKTKMIKITSKGLVTTSRGRFRSPLSTYKENVGNILIMIARDNAEIYEVLPDGSEVRLTVNNFDKDNTGVETVEPVVAEPTKKSSKVEKVEAPEKKEETPADAQEAVTARQLSRKERKRLEYEKKQKETEQVEQATTEESTAVPAEAIEQ